MKKIDGILGICGKTGEYFFTPHMYKPETELGNSSRKVLFGRKSPINLLDIEQKGLRVAVVKVYTRRNEFDEVKERLELLYGSEELHPSPMRLPNWP